jgi:uncharacterized protein (DUF1697 family)
MRWILLLRAVNLGPRNKLAMKDLKAVLEGLGHTQVTTYLNSGNATFQSAARSPAKLAAQVEEALRVRLDLDVRCCVRKDADLRKALDELPDLPGYVVVNVLFDPPTPEALRTVLERDWAPETVVGNDQVLYLAYREVNGSKLTNARLEKLLGVGCTARTPATLGKLLAG